jgi:alpha-mannosidase
MIAYEEQIGVDYASKSRVGGGWVSPGSMVSADPCMIVEAVKPSWDGEGIIVRVYEPLGRSCSGALKVKSPLGPIKAFEANILEDLMDELRVSREGNIKLELRPFEVKTIYVKPWV